MKEIPTKPYLIRAIYDWCSESGLTPHLSVKVDEQTRVPKAYVREGEIVLNIGMDAVRNLHLGNDSITCSARFGGVSHGIVVPVAAVMGIFARETGEGMAFQPGNHSSLSATNTGGDHPTDPPPSGKPRLRVVK